MQLFRHLRDPTVACGTSSDKSPLDKNPTEKVSVLFGYFGNEYAGPNAAYNHQYAVSQATESYGRVEALLLSTISDVFEWSSNDNALSVASRTDKGINAALNIMACKLRSGLCNSNFAALMNERLPPSMCVQEE